MASEFNLFAAFLIGLAGGVHCLGMCGGITVALQSAIPRNANPLIYSLSYHLGRIASYAVAGALAGYVGTIISHASKSHGLSILTILSGIMLVLLGSYIGNWYRGLLKLEKLGGFLWRFIQPVSKRLIPFRSPIHALSYGIVWGWLPCGLVYSTLSWSMAAGSSLQGGLIMLMFGLGTLPLMLAVSIGSSNLTSILRANYLKQFIALLLASYGVYLIFNGVRFIT
ncbi:sulfite exporter TauE/SafE family protein [Alteromonas facilis]|uniref:sulfite exporter TauE/SafE family protein n=1 Tax=Alteromonas facilis TaxID=2048004 RepID=UPI000C283A08|nr:sulfite exporter TauE/SafE family protein [Alteromonas facilis]